MGKPALRSSASNDCPAGPTLSNHNQDDAGARRSADGWDLAQLTSESRAAHEYEGTANQMRKLGAAGGLRGSPSSGSRQLKAVGSSTHRGIPPAHGDLSSTWVEDRPFQSVRTVCKTAHARGQNPEPAGNVLESLA